MSEETKVVNTRKRKTILIIIVLTSIIMTSIGVFLASYYSSINKVYDSYESALTTNINGINTVNTKTVEFSSNEAIDVEYAKKQLPIIIKELSTLRNGLVAVESSSKYKESYDNLKSGLDKNLLIYRQTLAILNNPSGGDVQISMDNLKTYRNDCINFYSLVKINNLKIELPKTSLVFIENVLNHSLSAVMAKKETDIKLQQNLEFVNKIDELSKSFLNIKTNHYPSALKARKKELSYDAILSEVENSFVRLNAIQTSFKGLSIPPTAIPTYESFKSLLGMHESYLRDFKLALSSEKVQLLGAVVDSSRLDDLYTSSTATFIDIEKSYEIFLKAFTELKNKAQ